MQMQSASIPGKEDAGDSKRNGGTARSCWESLNSNVPYSAVRTVTETDTVTIPALLEDNHRAKASSVVSFVIARPLLKKKPCQTKRIQKQAQQTRGKFKGSNHDCTYLIIDELPVIHSIGTMKRERGLSKFAPHSKLQVLTRNETTA